MSRTRILLKFVAILVLAVLAGFVVFDKLPLVGIKTAFPFRLGLDLQGGTHLVYEGDLKDIPRADRDEAMDAVRQVIERRVNAFGVTEPLVQRAGDTRLIVELPGIRDINEAIKQIGLTPFLEFRELDPDYTVPENPQEADFTKQFRPTGLSGKHLQRSEVVFNQSGGGPQISLRFNSEGEKLFSQITKNNIGRPVAIFLDGQIISAPNVQSEISSGEAVISGNFTAEEARQLAERLNAGALPVPIKLIHQQNIGPSLGQESLKKSIVAGLVGFAIIALFMIVYYRLSGLFAVMALVVYASLSLAIFKLGGVTLTLAGITGFILSVGMAVDANILVFERLKDELRAGEPLRTALDHAFSRAWNAIRDSNVSSLITVAILAYFGTSLIRGFAITLGIGVLASMFTALTVTRTFLRLFYSFSAQGGSASGGKNT
ncbi:MAG: protein-export membrane protein SecD [Candidatus Doudnabacteria bacterium RIFCSPHIGHO2_01_FULL_46_14]|uniref:Protein translocase subunit SecD n=1 Tax=Candidatus Doudnabacteria bacterium RIFCSPHIGHO2_01_FULL_46_14 TaxID=1817824 RepID=A0A1F5NP21_9BACT|nr:MAG: protein-export membrane protein SecD [Candidatus Doudnabacteria bacterium RIFCSPHIGHO2_01_FULL_46_14]